MKDMRDTSFSKIEKYAIVTAIVIISFMLIYEMVQGL